MKRILITFGLLVFSYFIFAQSPVAKIGNSTVERLDNDFIATVYNNDGIKIYFDFDMKKGGYYIAIQILRPISTELNDVNFIVLSDSMQLYGKEENQINGSYIGESAIPLLKAKYLEDFTINSIVNKSGYLNEYKIMLPNYKVPILKNVKKCMVKINIGVNEQREIEIPEKELEIIRYLGVIMEVIGYR